MIQDFLSGYGLDPEMLSLISTLSEHAEEADAGAQIPAPVLAKLNEPTIRSRYFSDASEPRGTDAVLRCKSLVALGFGDPALTVALPGPSLTLPILQTLATPEQKKVLFGYFAQRECAWGAFALTEPSSGSEALKLQTTATPCAEGYLLSGRKCYIGNAGRSTYMVVFATLDAKKGAFGVRAFYVPLPADGVQVTERESTVGMRVVRVSEITLERCFVRHDQMLGHGGAQDLARTFLHLQGCFNFMRPGLSSLMLGASLRVLNELQAAAGELPRAGQTAAAELVRQGRLRVRSGIDLCLRAATKVNRGEDAALVGSICKVFAVDTSRDIMRSALSLPNILQCSRAALFLRMHRDAQAFYLMEGTSDVQRLMIARGARRLLS